MLSTTNTAPVAYDFEQIYKEYHERIYQHIYHLISDREQAQDLTQDTFLRAFRALPTMQGPIQMAGWLYRIATNAAYDALRRRQLIRWDPVDELLYEPASHTEDDDPQAQYNGPRELIRLALERMPDSYRRALLLYIEEDYNYAQIAQALHIAPSGVKMYLTRARRHFKQQYAELEMEVAHV